jgi:hypothetical protein
MSRARLCARADGVHPQLLAELAPEVWAFHLGVT